jgi:hypothetical protein
MTSLSSHCSLHLQEQRQVNYRPQLLIFAGIELPEPDVSMKAILASIFKLASVESGVVSQEEIDKASLMGIALNNFAPHQRTSAASAALQLPQTQAPKPQRAAEPAAPAAVSASGGDGERAKVSDCDCDCVDCLAESCTGLEVDGGDNASGCSCEFEVGQVPFVPSAEVHAEVQAAQELMGTYRLRLYQRVQAQALSELIHHMPGSSSFNLQASLRGLCGQTLVGADMLRKAALYVHCSRECYVYVIQREDCHTMRLLTEGLCQEDGPNCRPEDGLELDDIECMLEAPAAPSTHTLSFYFFAFDRPVDCFARGLLAAFDEDSILPLTVPTLQGVRLPCRDFSELPIQVRM